MLKRTKNYYFLKGKFQDILDLVAQQKEEIEGLTMENEILRGYITKIGKELERANINIEKKDAEIKGLKSKIDDLEMEIEYHNDC